MTGIEGYRLKVWQLMTLEVNKSQKKRRERKRNETIILKVLLFAWDLLDSLRWGCQGNHPYNLRNNYQSGNKTLQQLIQIHSLELQIIYSGSTLFSYEELYEKPQQFIEALWNFKFFIFIFSTLKLAFFYWNYTSLLLSHFQGRFIFYASNT